MNDKYLIRSKEGAILNTDSLGLENYKKRKQKQNDMETRILNLENDITFIKNLLMEKLK